MKISLLLQREPFAQIFCKTLARYLTTTAGRSHRVRWIPRPAPLGQLARRPPGLWLVNPALNIIYSARAAQRVFANPWREYLLGSSALKTLAQGAYLAASTAPPGRLLLASHHLHIEPELDGAESVLILGGNSRLRLIDFARGRVISILKEGFDDTAFGRELRLRQSHAPPLAPPILEILDGGRAFAEPLLRASSAGRMLNKRRGALALQEAAQACASWSRASTRTSPWSRWWPAHRAACERLAAQVHDDSEGSIARLLGWMHRAAHRLKALGVGGRGVTTALSHGDLQSGNVLVQGDGRPWLIDWESLDWRVADYDAWTLALGPRYLVKGRMARLQSLARARLMSAPTDQIESRIILYLLEEIKFYLSECAIGPLYGPTPGARALAEEFARSALPNDDD